MLLKILTMASAEHAKYLLRTVFYVLKHVTGAFGGSGRAALNPVEIIPLRAAGGFSQSSLESLDRVFNTKYTELF